MKVLIVHHQMRLYGGAELVVVRLANYLQKRGHKVLILAASTAPHPEYRNLNIITPPKEVIWHLWNGTVNSMLEIGEVFLSLRKLCREFVDYFDVVNVHNFPTIWTVPGNKKIVWMCNEIPDLWHEESVSTLSNRFFDAGRLADRLVVRSKSPTAVVADERCAERFQHRYGFDPVIIPYGIDGAFFSQHTQALPTTSRDFCVIQPSMISPSKGQMSVLEATEGMNVKVVFAGYYEPNHLYTLKLIQRAAGRNVHFTGHISKRDLRDLYHQAHLAIFPGKGQGSWLGPFEALAAGCPIIVSPNLSCSGLIRSEDIGTVTSDLGEAIREIRHHYTEYVPQARRGREYVLDNLTWNNFGHRFEELMKI